MKRKNYKMMSVIFAAIIGVITLSELDFTRKFSKVSEVPRVYNSNLVTLLENAGYSGNEIYIAEGGLFKSGLTFIINLFYNDIQIYSLRFYHSISGKIELKVQCMMHLEGNKVISVRYCSSSVPDYISSLTE